MAKFEEQIHHCNCICPYCKNAYQVESEDYDQDEHEEECDECGKKFWHSESFEVTTETQ